MPNVALKKTDVSSDTLVMEKYDYNLKSKDLKGNQITIDSLKKSNLVKLIMKI